MIGRSEAIEGESVLGGNGALSSTRPAALGFETPVETASLQVWIHSYAGSVVEGYLDDLAIVETDAR